MAREKDDRKRKREREDELDSNIRARLGNAPEKIPPSFGGDTTEKLIELMDRAGPMIDQLNNLYNMYVAGVERLPPNERRKQLDQLMNQLQVMNKTSASLQFRYRSLFEHYSSFRDRWDKLLRDIESGKVRRRAGGGR